MIYQYHPWTTTNNESWFSCQPGKNGFMPVGIPLKELPDKYSELESILQNMPIMREGYLSKGTLKQFVDKLPLFNVKEENNKQLIAALYRDYCFLASAYSLEPSHLGLKDGVYGKARDILPPQISEPLIELAKKVEGIPWLDYAYGYGLNNAVLRKGCDPKLQLSYDTIRMFNGHASESGFINVHVAMVSESGKLLEYQQNCLKNISENNRSGVNEALQHHYTTLSSIVHTLETMWKSSNHKDYLTFRTFIMGQHNNNIYEEENIKFIREDFDVETHSYRGETGAQDSIVPSVDNLLELDYPENSLTQYLFDLRKYRPKDHQAYLNYVKYHSNGLGVKKYCLQDIESSILLLKNLNCLRMFRKKHWNLTKKYIIQNTKHPTATGGTPITTWLPNQLGATLEYMKLVVDNINVLLVNNQYDSNIRTNKYISDTNLEYFREIELELSDHIQVIMDEVSELQSKFVAKEQIHGEFLKRK